MIGPTPRPNVLELRPEWRAARFLARIGFAGIGDDALLKSIRVLLQEEGFRLVGAHDVLNGLLARQGLLTRTAPDEMAMPDTARGQAAAREIGDLALRGASVGPDGVVLALDAIASQSEGSR